MLIKDRAQRVRAEYIGLHCHDRGDVHLGRAQFGGQRRGAGRIDIGDGQPRALGGQRPGQRTAHAANALDGDVEPSNTVGAQFVTHRSLQPGQCAPRRERPRIAAHFAGRHRQPGHMRGATGNDHHIGIAHAHILGGQITAAERGDGIAKGFQQRFRLERVSDYHCLAAARLEPRHSVLVAHAAGQAQRIGERGGLAGIGPAPHTAGRRAKMGGMDGNAGMQASGRILHQRHAFMRVEPRRASGIKGSQLKGRETGSGGGNGHQFCSNGQDFIARYCNKISVRRNGHS